ncbi:MAG: hypothetical protein DRQ78_13585 [Epsilonproteobacteria bacterium]|nr:MAG: hypothetical protein DRQ78_13585 [Campylobacterota bacterium]
MLITLNLLKKLNGEVPFIYEKKSGGSGPSAEEIARAKQQEQESWDLEDAERRFNKSVTDYGSDYGDFQEKRRVSNELRSRGGMSDLISGKENVKEAVNNDYANKIKMPTFKKGHDGFEGKSILGGRMSFPATGTSYGDKMKAWEGAISDVGGQASQWKNEYTESDKDPTIEDRRGFKKPGQAKKKTGLMNSIDEENTGGLL